MVFTCQNVCDALSYILVYIKFGNKLYRHIIRILKGTNCAPLVADLFVFSYEKDFMTSLSKLKSRSFRATSVSTYDFSTLYTTLPPEKRFFTSTDHRGYKLWSCQNVCDALSYLLDYIRFGIKLYRHIVGILMGKHCAPLVADLFIFSYEKDFMTSLSDDNQADPTEAFNSISRYLEDLLNIDNLYFEGIFNQIYPPELQLNKANTSDTEAPLLDLRYIYLFLMLLFRPKFMINAMTLILIL